MRRLVALALAASMMPTAPATALPPLLVTGSGTISPGLLVCCRQAQSISFHGTGSTGVLTYACQFAGGGSDLSPGTVTGVLNGNCGPITYTGCFFELTPTTWTVACQPGFGSFSVSYSSVEPTTGFTATGVMA